MCDLYRFFLLFEGVSGLKIVVFNRNIYMKCIKLF